MKTQVIKIENKKYRIVPESKYKELQRDLEDLKKVFLRRNEEGIEANAFFAKTDVDHRKDVYR